MVFCHEFKLTGAPIVLNEALPYIKDFQLFVMGPEYGPMVNHFLENGIPVIIDPNACKASDITSLAFSADLVIANTIIMSDVVNMLSGGNTPVLWWLHDNELCYSPEIFSLSLEENIHIYCVSEYARRCFLKYQPDCQTQLLPYVLSDRCNASSNVTALHKDKKIKFSFIGSIAYVKGIDLLCKAISLLPKRIIKKCIFYFAGNINEPPMFEPLSALCKQYPDNVIYKGLIPRDQIDSLFEESDCLICPSRYDPLPTFITEGWMHGKFCLCSKNTGSAHYIIPGCNGYIIDPEDINSNIIKFIKEKKYKNDKIFSFCRNTYLNNFTPEIFNENFQSAISETTNNNQ